MAAVALRRWRGFPRRAGRGPRTPEARIADLASGLCAAYEVDRRLVGPLMADYRHVATVLGEVLLASALDG
jgi:hypothetical protein